MLSLMFIFTYIAWCIFQRYVEDVKLRQLDIMIFKNIFYVSMNGRLPGIN